MGLVNQMVKFIPDLANHNEPLRQLLKKENVWHWRQAREQSFQRIKEMLATPRSLAHHDPKQPTIVSTDASNLWRQQTTCVLRLTISDRNRETLCSHWKGSVCGNVGMWEVFWLRTRDAVYSGDGPQAISATPLHNWSIEHAVENPKI